MRNRQNTVATFLVRINIPKGSNCGAAQMYVQNALHCYAGDLSPENVLSALRPEDFTVRLVKKETNYA